MLDLGRGNPEVGPPAHVVEALREAAAPAGRPRLRAVPRPAAAERGDRGALPRPVRRRDRPRARGGDRARHEDGPRRARARARAARRHDPAPGSRLPRLPVGRQARRRRRRPAAARSVRGLGARLRRRAGRGGRVPQLPVEPVRGLRAARRLRGGGRLRRAHGRGDRLGRGLHRPRLTTAARPESFLATPGAKDVGVEMWTMSKTFGMAGWRIGFVVGNAEIVERVNLQGDHSRVGMFAPLQEAAIAALDRPAGLGRGAPRDLRAPPRPADRGAAGAARLRGQLLRLAPAAGRAHRRAAARRAPRRGRARRGLRAERRRLGARSRSP